MRFGDLIYAEGEKAKNHKPIIECPDSVKSGEGFELRVYVSGHPSRVDHSIRYIEVYFYEEGRDFNPIKLAKAVFTPEYVNPEVTLKLKLEKSGTIFALAYCNKHGLWESSKRVKVS